MGVRVDGNSLIVQTKKANRNEKSLCTPYHQAVLAEQLPYTIGGGLGQSRICIFLLGKAHIGEVQSSIWSQDIMDVYEKAGIPFL